MLHIEIPIFPSFPTKNRYKISKAGLGGRVGGLKTLGFKAAVGFRVRVQG